MSIPTQPKTERVNLNPESTRLSLDCIGGSEKKLSPLIYGNVACRKNCFQGLNLHFTVFSTYCNFGCLCHYTGSSKTRWPGLNVTFCKIENHWVRMNSFVDQNRHELSRAKSIHTTRLPHEWNWLSIKLRTCGERKVLSHSLLKIRQRRSLRPNSGWWVRLDTGPLFVIGNWVQVHYGLNKYTCDPCRGHQKNLLCV